jgi:hypothetical protein
VRSASCGLPCSPSAVWPLAYRAATRIGTGGRSSIRCAWLSKAPSMLVSVKIAGREDKKSKRLVGTGKQQRRPVPQPAEMGAKLWGQCAAHRLGVVRRLDRSTVSHAGRRYRGALCRRWRGSRHGLVGSVTRRRRSRHCSARGERNAAAPRRSQGCP